MNNPFRTTLILLAFIFCTSSSVWAQDIQRITTPPSPSDITSGQKSPATQNAGNLSSSELQEIMALIQQSGGKVSPQELEALRNLSPEQVQDLKSRYESQKGSAPQPPEGMPPSPTGEKANEQNGTIKKDNTDLLQKDKDIKEEKEKPVLTRFGMRFFQPSRNRILAVEKRMAEGQKPDIEKMDATSGFVGPLDMVSADIQATTPTYYALSPGDDLMVYLWADTIALATYKTSLDKNGMIELPQLGKIVARGMTLAQLQDALKKQMERVLGVKNLNLLVTLERLKSMQIFVTGEAFRPGSYAVSAVTSLFNALHACGGPSDTGSLRSIKLIRNKTEFTIDFYDYLLNGDGSKDYPLFPGDTIFIPKVAKLVSIDGDVSRPSIFELKRSESLTDLVRFANGLKPSAFSKKLQIQTVTPNKERIIKNADFDNKSETAKIALYDGDSVFVPTILPDIENKVTLKGAVKYPGDYEIKPGMTVADLFSNTNEPLGSADLRRSDIFRLNKDRKTTTLISLDLSKALAKDPMNNIKLRPFDTITVYTKWDLKYLPPRTIEIAGSVQRPGEYERSDGMTVSDLISISGGVLPDTYMKRADLLRYEFSTDAYTHIPIDLNQALNGDTKKNISLKDSDKLFVYAIGDVEYTPTHQVEISGLVQKEGTYKRFEGMHLSDLLHMAGGVTPGFYNKIEIAKARKDKTVETIIAELDDKGSPIDDPLLDDEDIIMVREKSSFIQKPAWVKITGEVQYPGTYPILSKDETLSSVLARAGGFTPYAYPKGTVFMRKKEYINSQEQRDLLTGVNEITNLINDLDFASQQIRNQLLLLEARNEEIPIEAFPKTSAVVSSSSSPEEAAAIGMAPQVANTTGQTLQKFLDATGASAEVAGQARKMTDADIEPPDMQRLILDIHKILSSQVPDKKILLMPGDTIHVPRKQDTVTVVGALMHPALIEFKNNDDGKSVEYYINRAGGFSDDAKTDKILIARVDGSIIPAEVAETIEPGDIIYVPTKVMGLEIVSRTDKIIEAVKFGLVAAGSVAVFIALIGSF